MIVGDSWLQIQESSKVLHFLRQITISHVTIIGRLNGLLMKGYINMETDRYRHITYGTRFAIDVDPPERVEDVLHYLLTGQLLEGRSLEDVTWTERADKLNTVILQE